MGSDWYFCNTFFGYEIKVTDNTTYRKLINKLFGLNSVIPEPFQITGILSEFHSRMEGKTQEYLQELDCNAYLIIGFNTIDDLAKLNELAKILSEYITDNPILTGLLINQKPAFYSGINWFNDLEDDTSDDDEEPKILPEPQTSTYSYFE